MKRITSFAIAAALGALGALSAGATAEASDLSYQCTNTASGTSWLVKVDDQKRTVDGVPADISAARISWRDASTGGSYDLDRKSGELTFTNSSSMGGYILWHRCQQK